MTKGKTAHARLIHGPFSILAPVPCEACQRRGTTCLVYPPHVFEVFSTPLSSSCSICTDIGGSCHTMQSPFNRYLEQAEDDNMDLNCIADGLPLPDRACNSIERPLVVGHRRRKQVDLSDEDMKLNEDQRISESKLLRSSMERNKRSQK